MTEPAAGSIEPAVVSGEGAPRDLGLDQGTACAAEIRDRVARIGAAGDWLGRWRPFDAKRLPPARATARDVRRHFPHLDERVIGIARGARVPELALHALLSRELGPEGSGARLQMGLDDAGRLVVVSPEPGLVRRAEPDAYFASLEWTLPWLPGAHAGVNSGGLAGAVRASGDDPTDGCAAPAFLLLQNCLHQFDSVVGAVEWCESRPAGGKAEILLCDAEGERAALVVEGEKRVRVEPASGEPPADGGALRIVLDPKARQLVAGATALRLS